MNCLFLFQVSITLDSLYLFGFRNGTSQKSCFSTCSYGGHGLKKIAQHKALLGNKEGVVSMGNRNLQGRT